MAEIELFVFLLFAVVVLAGLGLRSGVPYPVVLVLGGLVIGLVPGLPSPELDPDIIFFVFLPPLLYAAAITVSAARAARELGADRAARGRARAGRRSPPSPPSPTPSSGIPWAVAFVLGAVLGPTDPVSAAAVLDRLGVTGRAKTILQGESLVNDATGLTAYRIALAAVGGERRLGRSGSASSSSDRRRRRDRDRARRRAGCSRTCGGSSPTRRLDVTLSLLTPFVAYVPAEELHVSGVLAAVAAGLYVGSPLARHHRAWHPPAARSRSGTRRRSCSTGCCSS